ncbi:MAG TPA: helix-turn-helix domain-containing protein [Vicinamibacterales bacterium]|nr:helix-turn-helix domain-containing protein [Vicinamibacterales bacterium]
MEVLTDASRLAAALSPVRMRVLKEMQEPQSATTLSPRLGLSRQTLNYHLRELEREGFLELVEERPRRGCVERMLKVASRAFVVNPALLGALSDDPDQARDRFSSAFLVATATRLIRDVALLDERARAVDQRLATFTMECDVGFASPVAYRSFTEELADAVTRIAARYDTTAPKSRRFRVVVGSHPLVTKTEADAAAETARHRGSRRRTATRNRARRHA